MNSYKNEKISNYSYKLFRSNSASQKTQISANSNKKGKVFEQNIIPKSNFYYSTFILGENNHKTNFTQQIFNNDQIKHLNSPLENENRYNYEQKKLKYSFSQYGLDEMIQNQHNYSRSINSKSIVAMKFRNKKNFLNKYNTPRVSFFNQRYKTNRFNEFQRRTNYNFLHLHKTTFLGFNNFKYWKKRQNVLKNPRNKEYYHKTNLKGKNNYLRNKNPDLNQNTTKIGSFLKVN